MRPQLPALTSLRFFAALAVVAHHYLGFKPGYGGVTFFYVLSGFVLSYNYAGRVSGASERARFWLKRFARVYPAHALTLLLAIPLGWPGLQTALANGLLLQSWIPHQAGYFSLNSVSWSLSDEAFFYALFPFLAFAGLRLALGILAAVFAVACAASIAWPGAAIGSDPVHFLFYIAPAMRLGEFMLGMALARVSRKALGLGSELAVIGLGIGSVILAPHLPPPFALSLVFVPAAALAVYVFARSAGSVGRLLAHPALIVLGEASFALYLTHQLLQRYLTGWLGPGHGAAIVGLALCVPLALLMHYGFERPVQRWIVRDYRPGLAALAREVSRS